MKNIHILPTDKPSRLGYLTKKGKEVFKDLRLFDRLIPNILDNENQNIYITNNEKPKDGDWCIITDIKSVLYGQFEKHRGTYQRNDQWKKIILTTDQDLIKDGVQAIDDEFLEWFVKNPSCEDAEINKEFQECMGQCGICDNSCGYYYKIIILKEEPKQETVEEIRAVGRTELYNSILSIVKQIPRKEVESDAVDAPGCAYELEQLFYKWQKERMYSEEEVYHILCEHTAELFKGSKLTLSNWFEQFKKKQP